MVTTTLEFVNLVARQATSTSSATASPTSNSNSGNSGGGGTSTPSLFFIALGIGVVFINLWLVIGIKYCCRRRRRRLSPGLNNYDVATNEELQNLSFYPTTGRFRPLPRRRREKKLLTMDELDEKFPIQKYKEWCSHRELSGLSTEGGISSAAAQALSNGEQPINEEDGHSISDDTKKDQPYTVSTNVVEDTETLPPFEKSEDKGDDRKSEDKVLTNARTSSTIESLDAPAITNMASKSLDPDQSKMAGDLCAICIDSLESDDDVRALSCHHVFHSDCVTPWLTTRRAICPLCKTDFYVPPQSEENSSQVLPEVFSEMPTDISRPRPAVITGDENHPQLMYPWEVFVRAPRHFRSNDNSTTQVSPFHLVWPYQRNQSSAPVNEPTPGPSRNWFWQPARPNNNNNNESGSNV